MKIKFLWLCLLLCNTVFAQNIHSITAKELTTLISDSLQLIDVRSPEEFATGHLKYAKCVNINDADFEMQISKYNKTKPTYIYCLSGARSKNAAQVMNQLSFENIFTLEGGFIKWRYDNNEIKYDIAQTSSSLDNSKLDIVNIIKNNKLVLIELYAVWCGPCKLQKPIVESIANEYNDKLNVQFIDVDKNKTFADFLKISSIPVLLFYKNGKLKWELVGLQNKKKLLKKMKL